MGNRNELQKFIYKVFSPLEWAESWKLGFLAPPPISATLLLSDPGAATHPEWLDVQNSLHLSAPCDSACCSFSYL